MEKVKKKKKKKKVEEEDTTSKKKEEVVAGKVIRKKTVAVTMVLPENMVDEIERLSEEDFRSMSSWVAFKLIKYVRFREKKVPGISNTGW